MTISMGTRVWSKGLDLRSSAKRFVGSNPTSCIKRLVSSLQRIIGVVASMSAFQAGVPGSIPG